MRAIAYCLLAALVTITSARAGIVERRIWVESAIDSLKEEQCEDKIKTWRCIFPDRVDCIKAMKEAYKPCPDAVLPDLPEYIDSPETKAAANKIMLTCMTAELTKKYVLTLPRDKMEEYNVCTGSVARSKPLSVNLQKALDYSKSITGSSCANGSFFRKCFSMAERDCKDTLEKLQLDCTMKMEADGVSVKAEESAIQDVGNKITNCAIPKMRGDLDAKKKRLKDKDCE